jgi:O-antigen/teichoic acid export membrane protein
VPQSTQQDDTVTAGRGFLLISGAKLYFIVASAILNIGLPRLLGDPARFGEFKVVNSLISILNMVVIIGTIQAVSKLVSEREGRARSTRLRALQLQVGVGGVLAVSLILGAGAIATHVFKDPSLAIYLRIGAVVTFFYALYAVFVGLLNGLKRFGHQASLDILFSTLKLSFIIGLVLLGFGVMGAFVGFACAAVVIVVCAGYLSNRNLPPKTETVSTRQLGNLLAPLLISTLLVNILLQLDILCLKGLAFNPIIDHFSSDFGQQRLTWLVSGLGVQATPDLAQTFSIEATSHLTGLFGGAKNISLLPYQATIALTFVVFPLVSKATFEENAARAKASVRQSIRFTILIAGVLVATLIATARPLLTVLLGAKYGEAGLALAILLGAAVLLAVLIIGVTILNSSGQTRAAVVIAAVTLATNGALIWLLLRLSPDLRLGPIQQVAWATSGSIAVGCVLCLWTVVRRFGRVLPMWTILRVLCLGAALVALSTLWTVTSFITLMIKALAVGLFFVAGLLATRELGPSDRVALKRILGFMARKSR